MNLVNLLEQMFPSTTEVWSLQSSVTSHFNLRNNVSEKD